MACYLITTDDETFIVEAPTEADAIEAFIGDHPDAFFDIDMFFDIGSAS